MSVIINTLQAYRRLQEGGFTDEQAEAIVDVFRMIDPHLYRQVRKRADEARAEAAEQHQEHWDELCRDPSLNDLPYKVETNARGQLVLTRIASNRRSIKLNTIREALNEHAPDGYSLPSFPIATPHGVKVPDVVWSSPDRRDEMEETGDPTTLAPEICVELLRGSNDWQEMGEKRRLYREAGAEEVWVVDDHEVRFFSDEEIEQSEIAPGFPRQIS